MSKFENGKIILENGEVIHPTKKQEWFEQILEYKDSIFVETRNNVYKINIKTKEQLEQADDMNEANLSALKKMEILGGGDVNIGPPVINNVDISVEYRP